MTMEDGRVREGMRRQARRNADAEKARLARQRQREAQRNAEELLDADGPLDLEQFAHWDVVREREAAVARTVGPNRTHAVVITAAGRAEEVPVKRVSCSTRYCNGYREFIGDRLWSEPCTSCGRRQAAER